MSDLVVISLTIARWLTNVYDVDTTAENYTTPGDVTLPQLQVQLRDCLLVDPIPDPLPPLPLIKRRV